MFSWLKYGIWIPHSIFKLSRRTIDMCKYRIKNPFRLAQHYLECCSSIATGIMPAPVWGRWEVGVIMCIFYSYSVIKDITRKNKINNANFIHSQYQSIFSFLFQFIQLQAKHTHLGDSVDPPASVYLMHFLVYFHAIFTCILMKRKRELNSMQKSKYGEKERYEKLTNVCVCV